MLKPHFAPHGQTTTGKYYSNMLESDVLRQLDVEMEGKKYHLQQDLATSHTAKETTQLLKKEGVSTVPWMTAGADISPLDVFVHNASEENVRGRDLGNLNKLKKECALAIAELSSEPAFKRQLAQCCRSFEKRVRWIAANGGRKVNRKEATEQWFKWFEHFKPQEGGGAKQDAA